MPIVRYTNTEGITSLRLVSENTPEEDYYLGGLIGPPDLSELNIDQETLKKLYEKLVDMGLVNAICILNRRHEIKQIVKSLGLNDSIVKHIVSIFQTDYF